MFKIETRTFGRISWHVVSELRLTLQGTVMIPEPHATIQSAVTWQN